MPRQRLPAVIAKATGAALKNPGRFRGRNDPASPLLGEPSKFLPVSHKRAWRMFQADLPWLVEADRPMVEAACSLRAQLIAGRGDMGLNALQLYSSILSKLGATPVDRSRTQPLDPEREPDEFFGD
jgi:hypothetical protein